MSTARQLGAAPVAARGTGVEAAESARASWPTTGPRSPLTTTARKFWKRRCPAEFSTCWRDALRVCTVGLRNTRPGKRAGRRSCAKSLFGLRLRTLNLFRGLRVSCRRNLLSSRLGVHAAVDADDLTGDGAGAGRAQKRRLLRRCRQVCRCAGREPRWRGCPGAGRRHPGRSVYPQWRVGWCSR